MSEKCKITLDLTEEALEIALRQGYATRKTLGDFLSQLILDYHRRQRHPIGPQPAGEEWQKIVDEAEQLLRAERAK